MLSRCLRTTISSKSPRAADAADQKTVLGAILIQIEVRSLTKHCVVLKEHREGKKWHGKTADLILLLALGKPVKRADFK